MKEDTTKDDRDRSHPMPDLQLTLSSTRRGMSSRRVQAGVGVNAKTYTIGEIMDLFDLEAGDAWVLVLDKGWECVQPLPDTRWQVTIPPDELP